MLRFSIASRGPKIREKVSRSRVRHLTSLFATMFAARRSFISSARSPKYCPFPYSIIFCYVPSFCRIVAIAVPSLIMKNFSPVAPCLMMYSPLLKLSSFTASPSLDLSYASIEARIGTLCKKLSYFSRLRLINSFL